jgi:2-polyprenyl-6-methoxyphenol hydroxylase-like FAD-dependent oxidoreductase
MKRVNKVLIVGGGIAGLTAAIALAKNGIAAEVAEITACGEPIGAAITITGQALQALAAVDLLEACKELGCVNPLTGRSYDPAGVLLSDGTHGAQQRPSAVSIYRPILAELLRTKALAAGCELRFNSSVRALAQDPDGVSAEFTDGRTARYDLVIGADGVHSAVRGLVFGNAVRPLPAGQTAIRWMAEGPPIDGPTMVYRAPSVYLLSIPLAKQNFIYVTTVSNFEPAKHVDDNEARAILAAQLACFTAPYVVELARRLTPRSRVIVRPFEWLLMPDPWFRGRVLLIGDAAHATTAHLASGGGMALEDAVVLSECLAAAHSVPTGLAAFMRRRFERAQLVVETSVKIIELEKGGTPPNIIDSFRMAAFKRLAAPY